ncbi:MAG: hypothetical protein ACREUX_13190 [Burkholderiales bacterium]
MSRTFRRRGQRHEYRWVLREWYRCGGTLIAYTADPRSMGGRRAVARFHSDAERTMRSGPPRWYRRVFDRRLRTLNFREIRRWIEKQDYEPVIQARHRHNATWTWW